MGYYGIGYSFGVAHFSSNNLSSTSMILGGETVGSNLEAGMIKQSLFFCESAPEIANKTEVTKKTIR